MPALDATLLQIQARTGPMTDQLVRRPGDFGLGQVPARLAPVATTKSICGYCATGCSLHIHLDAEGQAINLTPDPAYPVNIGMACPKGWEALTSLSASDRVTSPLLRNPATGKLEPVSWPTAMRVFTDRMQGAQAKHGAHSIAFLSTGQVPTEEMALLGALFKFGMGGLHCDSNTRQCMATSHVAYKQAFGFDSPPYTYQDFEESDVLVFVGSNPAIAHPIMWQRVMMNKNSPEIIVVDPRRTETAMCATRHVPLRPKSDLWLLYGIARVLLEENRINREFIDAHTTGFDAFARFLDAYTPEAVALMTGIAANEIREIARIIGRGKAVSFWWTMGVNQGHESTRTAQALINLALMTGNIGRPGTGANSITGQCNAMGSRLFANATSLFGGRDFANATHRAEVARILDIPVDRIPAAPSKAYDQIIDGIETGDIRALWIIATNTAHSWIDQSRFARLREKLDFLVVQDMYSTTESARLADLVLPAAGWGEKEGFFINSERRLGRIRKVSRAPGQALSDFAIFKLIAETWGCGDLFRRWSTPAASFQIIKELSAGRPCDITGIRDHDHLESAGGIQWPYAKRDAETSPLPASPAENQRRLFADGVFFTPDGRAKFLFDEPRPMPEAPDADYPFYLNTGRGSSAQWHTGSRTNKSDVLRKLAPTSLYVEINPADATRLGIANDDDVIVSSRRGEALASAVITATVQPGQLFMPMHFDTVNRLTFPAYDPHSRQPSYKACAVRIRRA
ncbi:MAG TPA: nitrate reductase [Luteolibacter sp.]